MNPVNPYEPPQTPEPLKRAQIVKRGLGVALILLLTPPAMAVTVFASCTLGRMAPGQSRLLFVFVVPIAVLTGLMVWAMFLDRPRLEDPNQKPSRAGLFLATPAVVAVAMIVGFVFAAAMVLLPRTLRQYEWALQNAAYFFWPVPAVALLAMLTIAWRGVIVVGRDRSMPQVKVKPDGAQLQSPQPDSPAPKPPTDRGLNL
jgi:hypothetical protein